MRPSTFGWTKARNPTPAVGRDLARAALGEGLASQLRPEARLGAELFESVRQVL